MLESIRSGGSSTSTGVVNMYGLIEIKEVLECRDKGWSQRETADYLSYSRNFVRKYWNDKWSEIIINKRRYQHKLDNYYNEIIKYYNESENNCDVVRYYLMSTHPDLKISLRTIERYIEPLRRQKILEDKKYKIYRRFETHPGEFMQIDYGSKSVVIAGKKEKIHLFIAVLTYSRRIFVKLTQGETQDEWLSCIEDAFSFFGGRPNALVCDNAAPLVSKAARREDGSRTCVFTQGLIAFGTYWGVEVKACYPYYPQSKGKVESAVGYVKHNGIAGKEFASREELQEHLIEWATTYADWKPKRIEGAEEIVPAKRFEIEKPYLRAITKPRFHECKEVVRRVRSDGVIQVDNDCYQLPIQFAKVDVRVLVRPQTIEVYQGDKFLQEFNKAKDKKIPEILDLQSRFGATDPSLQTPVSLQRDLGAYDKACREAAARTDQTGSQSVNSTSGTESGSPGISAETDAFTRDLSAYEQLTGGF